MIVILLILLASLGPLAYVCGADSRVLDKRDTRRWL
jgi:hypothetical protein